MAGFTKHTLAIVLIGLLSATVMGQRWGSGDGEPLINPNSGAEIDPTFCYDSVTGLYYLENDGPNGVVDSADNLLLLGDDVGFNSGVFSAREGLTITDVNPPFGDGVVWGPAMYFNGIIAFGVSTTGAFVPISDDPIALFQLDPGLGFDDFRDSQGNVTIEAGISFSLGALGGPIFSIGDAAATGAFKIVPEPESFALIVSSLFGLLIRRLN